MPLPTMSATPLTLTQAQVERLGVQVSPVLPAVERGRVVIQGTVVQPAHLQRVISAPAASLVEQVKVNPGDAVKGAQVLLTLAAPQLIEWQRDQIQATLQARLAQQAAQRDAALLAEGIIAASRAQASQAQWEAAQAALQERQQQLMLAGAPKAGRAASGAITVTAPTTGTVVEVLVQAGQRVEAGAPLMKFIAPGPLDIVMQATADVALKLRPGDPVLVAGCAVPARLASVNPQIDATSQTVAVRARWPQAQACVLPQQRVQAEVLQQEPGSDANPRWWVPASAVIRHNGQAMVFLQTQAGQYLPVGVTVLAERAASAGQAAAVQVQGGSAQALPPASRVVSQGAVALKGMLQGLGAQ